MFARCWHTGAMLAAYAHQATLVMSPEADIDAVSVAVALELCGSWHHDPPCPLPHTTHGKKTGNTVTVRVVFAAEAENVEEVRRRIEKALSTGSVAAPDGSTTEWELCGSESDEVSTSEVARAQRLVGA